MENSDLKVLEEKENSYFIIEALKKTIESFIGTISDYQRVTKVVGNSREVIINHYKQIIEAIDNGKKFISPSFLKETIERSISLGISIVLAQLNMPNHQIIKKLSASVEFLNLIIDKDLETTNKFLLDSSNPYLEAKLKILDCLYEISKISEKPDINIEEIIKEGVNLIPSAWHFPEKICARIILNNQIVDTENFRITPWRYASDLIISGNRAGVVEVYLIEKRPVKDNEFFTTEEKHLIYLIAERLGSMIEWLKTEEENKKFRDKLNESQKMDAISTLAGGIAHEFNNALFGIIGNIELIQKSIPDDEKLKNYMEHVLNSSNRIVHLVKQLIAYSRGGKYHPQIIPLNILITNVLSEIQHSINPSIKFESYLNNDIKEIKCDIAQIKMVIAAIIRNAADAIENSGIIRISTMKKDVDEEFIKNHLNSNKGMYVVISVEDNGTGMDPETKKRLFEPFFTTKFQGRGLDMAATYGIIQNHNGWIEVESEFNKGTKVSIGLPAYISTDKKEQSNLIASIEPLKVTIEPLKVTPDTSKSNIEKILSPDTKELYVNIPSRLADRVRTYALNNNSTTTGVVIEALDALLRA